jgi:hypothetical protein
MARVERQNTERPGVTDLLTRCDNPVCNQEKYNGYTAPWLAYGGVFSFTWDGWHKLHGDVDACSWACLAVVAADRAKSEGALVDTRAI